MKEFVDEQSDGKVREGVVEMAEFVTFMRKSSCNLHNTCIEFVIPTWDGLIFFKKK